MTKGSPIRRLLWPALLLLLLVAPNLIWLHTSTLRFHNASGSSIYSLEFEACGERHDVGPLAAGRGAFRFLESCGDDTLKIVNNDAVECQLYVEGELYHVEAVFDGSGLECSYADPFSTLFVTKLLP